MRGHQHGGPHLGMGGLLLHCVITLAGGPHRLAQALQLARLGMSVHTVESSTSGRQACPATCPACVATVQALR